MTSPNTTAMILSLVSGLSTTLGGLIVILFDKPSENTVGWMLGISSGVMLFVSTFDLLPESVEKIGIPVSLLCFLLGCLLFYAIIKLIPEPKPEEISKAEKVDTKLLMTGLVVFTGISLHNFPEGMAVYFSTLKGWSLGLTIAIVVASTIYAGSKSKYEALKWTFLSGMCEPLGAFAFGFFFYHIISEYFVYCMLSGVSGVMVFICLQELIPSAYSYLNLSNTIISNVIGMILIYSFDFLLD
eukprot:gene6216-10222_t